MILLLFVCSEQQSQIARRKIAVAYVRHGFISEHRVIRLLFGLILRLASSSTTRLTIASHYGIRTLYIPYSYWGRTYIPCGGRASSCVAALTREWSIVLQCPTVASRLQSYAVGLQSKCAYTDRKTSERLLTNNRILFSHHENQCKCQQLIMLVRNYGETRPHARPQPRTVCISSVPSMNRVCIKSHNPVYTISRRQRVFIPLWHPWHIRRLTYFLSRFETTAHLWHL